MAVPAPDGDPLTKKAPPQHTFRFSKGPGNPRLPHQKIDERLILKEEDLHHQRLQFDCKPQQSLAPRLLHIFPRYSYIIETLSQTTANMADAAAAPSRGGLPTVSEYDLIPKLVSHLDRHMIFPLLEFSNSQLEDEDGNTKDVAKAREITQAKYELLKKTNMTDYVANLYCELEGLNEPPAEFNERREKVIAQLKQFEEDTSKIRDLLADEAVVSNLRSDKVANLEFLKREHEVCCCHGRRDTLPHRSGDH